MKPNSSITFYTGFPSFDVLVATFIALKRTAQNMYSWSQMQHLRNKGIENVEGLWKNMQGCKLSLFDQFYRSTRRIRYAKYPLCRPKLSWLRIVAINRILLRI